MEPTNQGEVGKEVAKPSQVIQIDEGKIQEHLGEVRGTVEETLNAMLDAEADRLCRAERYERTEARTSPPQWIWHLSAGHISLQLLALLSQLSVCSRHYSGIQNTCFHMNPVARPSFAHTIASVHSS
jgi:hypothetical protein